MILDERGALQNGAHAALIDGQPAGLGFQTELGLGHAALELLVGKLNGQLPLFNVVVDPCLLYTSRCV